VFDSVFRRKRDGRGGEQNLFKINLLFPLKLEFFKGERRKGNFFKIIALPQLSLD